MTVAARQLTLFPDGVEQQTDPSGFTVRKSHRAKRLSIKVFPRGRVEVVVPPRTAPATVQKFVAENSDWIRRARASFAELHPPEPFQLPARIELPAIGRHCLVRYERPNGRKTVRYRCVGNTLVLSGRTDDDQACVVALRRWLASVAKQEFAPRLQALSTATGIGYQRLQVRGQKTCWGSRSSTGTISINYCLLFLDPAAVRYLMIHELCHARHMNHSASFWRLVASFEPDYRRLDQSLTDSWHRVPVWVGIN